MLFNYDYLVSARSFTIEETERYAGSLGDPSRMASNYAGVSMVSDQRNDIVIRGNSPTGVLWRLEGVDIPNPNHFGAAGSTGGPVSMLNNNVLANSDFLTGAFPAEYGNALSGAFDLQMRPGNNEKHEFLGQVGFNGFEAGVEGPFSKQHKASYLANFRYSTLELMGELGFDTGTGEAIPEYKDLTFKLNFPLSQKQRLSIVGLGGISYIELLDSKNTSYGFSGSDIYFGTDMGVLNIEHNYYLTEKSRITNHFSFSAMQNKTDIDSIQIDELGNTSTQAFLDGKFTELTFQWLAKYFNKINSRNTIEIGTNIRYYKVDYTQKIFDKPTDKWYETMGDKGDFLLYKSYAQWVFKLTDQVHFNTGMQAMYFDMTKSFSAEPRFAVKWQFSPKQSLSFGFGMHSQLQPLGTYLTAEVIDSVQNISQLSNDRLDFSKSIHYVMGYDFLMNDYLRLKMDLYYQSLYNIPVHPDQPEYSTLNQGDNFAYSIYHHMLNHGTGFNYGTEITLERFLNKGYYYLFTLSLFESKYCGYDKVERNTAFNGNYVLNALTGYEFKVGKNNLLAFDIKTVYAGGKRYIEINEEQSRLQGEAVYNWQNAYENKLDDYFRINARITFKINAKHLSQEWGLDLQNLTNHQNIYLYTWNNSTKQMETSYQTGFMPMMTYKLRF